MTEEGAAEASAMQQDTIDMNNTAGGISGPVYVNYLDVKLESICGVPDDWISAGVPLTTAPTGAGGGGGSTRGTDAASVSRGSVGGSIVGISLNEVAYGYHPFRYEVGLRLPDGGRSSGAGTGTGTGAADRQRAVSSATTSASPPSRMMSTAAAQPTAAADAVAAAATTTTGDGKTGTSSAVIATFTHGRLLQPLSLYTTYVRNAAPPPTVGIDDVAPLRDVPPPVEVEALGLTAAAASGTGADSPGGVSQVVSAATIEPPARPVILWVTTDKSETAVAVPGAAAALTATPSAPAGTAGKRRPRGLSSSSASGAPAAAAALTALNAPPPPLPDLTEPAPCVVRVPLTAAEEAQLHYAVEVQAPLELVFRRVLRPGCPADWEDLNAGYYEAVVPVPLTALAVPGSTHTREEVPLQPAAAYATRRGSGAQGSAADTEAAVAAVASALPSAPHGKSGNNSNANASENPERAKKRTLTRKGKQNVPATLIDEPDKSLPHPYTTAGTHAVVSINLQRTLTRLVSDRVRPAVTPSQLIPSRPPPQASAGAGGDAGTGEVRSRLRSALRGIAQQLLRDVEETSRRTTGSPMPAIADLRQKAATEAEMEDSHAEQDGSPASAAAANAEWRRQFVSLLQSTGHLAAVRTHLTPLVTELASTKLRLGPDASAEAVARASHDLYVQLLDLLHEVLRETAPGGSPASSAPSRDHGATRMEAGLDAEELLWRAVEAEVCGDIDLAGRLYQTRLSTNAGDAGSWAALWLDCAGFYQRTGTLAKSEPCYREAIACDSACAPALLDYGVWLLAHDRLDEAAVFLHGLVDVSPRHYLGWAFVVLLADLRELAVRPDGTVAVAEQETWASERQLALKRAVESAGAPCSAASVEGADGASEETAQIESLYRTVAAYLLELRHRDLANVCLSRCRPGTPAVELLYAHLFAQGGQHAEALAALDAILPEQTLAAGELTVSQANALLLRADCAAALGRTKEAVELYKRSLSHANPAVVPSYVVEAAEQWRVDAAARVGSTAATAAELVAARENASVAAHHLSGYVRLCNLLLAEGRYRDAVGVVTLGLQVWPSSAVLWLGAGVAYYRVGDLVSAEACLQESNTVNPTNARTWVFLALLSIRVQHVGVMDLVEQVFALELDDAALWLELGRTLLGTGRYPKLSIASLRRAVVLAEGPETSAGGAGPGLSSLATSALYHLSHALMDGQQWGEAEKLLTTVAIAGSGNEVLRGRAEEELAMLRGTA